MMKKLALMAFAILAVAGCSKNSMESEPVAEVYPAVSEAEMEEAKADFAAILSKAVSSDESLRQFIKKTAMEQFDLDYDVFYPYVKDQIVSDGRTFREILFSYADDPSRLAEIEKELPLLTILVPDWSLFGCFNVKDWNPAREDIAVGYETDAEEKPLYAEGGVVGVLTDGAIPDFPTLIVKNSDRMRLVGTTTRSGEYEYAFVDDAFNAALHPQTKVSHIYQDIPIDGTPDISNYIPASEVPTIVKEAYEKLKDDDYAIQRDYIYFGITPEQPVGKVNPHIKEYIHKIKVRSFMDALTEGEDFHERYHQVEDKGKNSAKPVEELRDCFYYDGNIELVLHVIAAKKGGSASEVVRKVINASFADIFAIDHVEMDFRHKTAFCRDWYVYTFDNADIKPKWFTVDLELPYWDISNESTELTIYAEEHDSGANINKEITTTYKDAEVIAVNTGNDNTGVTVNYSDTSEDEVTVVTNIETVDNSDDLGTALLDFRTPVCNCKKTEEKEGYYYINTVSTGAVDLMIMPEEI